MASAQARRRCLALVAHVWGRPGAVAEAGRLSHGARQSHKALSGSLRRDPFTDGLGQFHTRGFASVSAQPTGEPEAAETPVGRQYPAVGQSFKETAPIEGGSLTLETGKLARLADAAVVVGFNETKVLCTAIASRRMDSAQSFLPLTVDYREKDYAQGKIPGGYFRREGAPQTRELLCSRLIDRAMRPLFPEGFYCETQLLANVLSLDGSQDPDVLAINGASAALTISDIPWNGPVGAVRIARINGRLVVNPGLEDWGKTDLSLVYAGTERDCVMMDVQAKEISNEDLAQALRLAHQEAQKVLDVQRRLAQQVNHAKRERMLEEISEELVERIREAAGAKISAIMEDPSYGKQERGKALAEVEQEVRAQFEEAGDADAVQKLPLAFDELKWRIIRRNIIDRGVRPDHRPLDQVRPIHCEADFLPALHGSSLFSRGNTQVVCTVTLGSVLDAQKLDTMGGPDSKRFMLHYSFPPYATNEVKRVGAVNRREVGHGMLAEKALAAVMPDDDAFPFTVRVTSECTASDGSSSMATVCGGSLALMDAGVPITKHVAGVSVGLFTDTDADNTVRNYKLVTDIVGLEDHLGDMDFKVAGTRDGVTAIQLDMKLPGIPLEILVEGLDAAQDARRKVITLMEQEIAKPREVPKDSHPRLATLPVDRASLGKVIGPLGATIKGIQAESGARLKVEDGGVQIFAKDTASFNLARHLIEMAVGKDVEIGKVYDGVVTSVRDYGALVELDGTGGQEGLLHISEISENKIKRVEDVMREGDRVRVLCTGRNIRGDTRLSIKALNRADSAGSSDSEDYSPGSDSDASSSYRSSSFRGDGPSGAERGEGGTPRREPTRRITEDNVELGKTYRAKVVSVRDYGAFLELETGEQGLLHVSQISHGFITSIKDHVTLDQELEVVVVKEPRDGNGVTFSRLPLLRKPPKRTTNSPIVIPGRRNES